MYVNPYALRLIFPSILMLAVSLWIWRNRRERTIQTFSVLTILCALYAVGYALEISSSTLELKLFWGKVEYIAIVIAFIPALLLLFALDYAGLVGRSYYKLAVALSVIPLVILTSLYTNDFHGLFYQDTSLVYGGLFPVFYFKRGPFY